MARTARNPNLPAGITMDLRTGNKPLLVRVSLPRGKRQGRRFFLPPKPFNVLTSRLPTEARAWADKLLRNSEAGLVAGGPVTFQAATAAWCGVQRAQGHDAESIRKAERLAGYLDRLGIRDLTDKGFGLRFHEALGAMAPGWYNANGDTAGARSVTNGTRQTYRNTARKIVNFAMDNLDLPRSPLLRKAGKLAGFEYDKRTKPVFEISELRRLLSDDARFPNRRRLKDYQATLAECGGSRYEVLARTGMARNTQLAIERADMDYQDPWWLAFAILTYTGLRVEEAMHLRWEWISFESRVIQTQPYKDPLTGEILFSGGKTGDACVRLMEELATILLQARGEIPRTGWVFPDERFRLNGSCTVERSREKPQARNYWRTLRLYLQRNGIDVEVRKLGPHCLRHTYASIRRAMGDWAEDIRDDLGHSETRTTEIYSSKAKRYRDLVRGWPKGEFVLRRDLMPAGKPDTDSELIVVVDEEDAA